MNIVIEKSEVLDALHRISADFGVKLQAPGVITATKDDEERLLPMWRDTVAELVALLSPYCTLDDVGDKVLLYLEMPANWKISAFNNLVAQCKAFFSNALFARWLDAIKPDTAALYRNLNKNSIMAIERILALREKPVRTV